MSTYDLGDVVALSATVRDEDGDLVDAGSIVCTVTLPDGTSATPTVTRASLGTYTATYTPAAVGRYLVRWVTTGAGAAAFADDFTVISAASAAAGIARADLALELRTAIVAADYDAADAACADAWACICTYLGADPAALTLDPWQVGAAQKVAKRVAARFFTNPLDRSAFSGPEGMSYTTSPLVSSRLLTPDERAMLDALGAPGFA